jgi:dihydropteroate synthase
MQVVKDIIIDPGFGFAKTVDQNFELLNKLDHLQIFEKPFTCRAFAKIDDLANLKNNT